MILYFKKFNVWEIIKKSCHVFKKEIFLKNVTFDISQVNMLKYHINEIVNKVKVQILLFFNVY